MTAKDFLQQAYFANHEVEMKLERIERLSAFATRVTTQFKVIPVPSSNSSSRIEKAVTLIDEQTDLLADEIVNLLEIIKNVANAISTVKNFSERSVLEYRYLCFFSWKQISALMKTGVSNVYKIHSNALKNFSCSVVNSSKF